MDLDLSLRGVVNGLARAESEKAGRMDVEGCGEISRLRCLDLTGEKGFEVVTVVSVLTARDLCDNADVLGRDWDLGGVEGGLGGSWEDGAGAAADEEEDLESFL